MPRNIPETSLTTVLENENDSFEKIEEDKEMSKDAKDENLIKMSKISVDALQDASHQIDEIKAMVEASKLADTNTSSSEQIKEAKNLPLTSEAKLNELTKSVSKICSVHY